MESRQAGWILPRELPSVPGARRLVAAVLHAIPADDLQVALVLTSELVTNAVRHGTGPIRLHVAWSSRGVRVEVEDQSPERPVVRVVDSESTQGRGLLLVDAMSSGWGVRGNEPGKTVWFTLAISLPAAEDHA